MALYPGLDPQKAAKRHVRYAQALIDAGFDFQLQDGTAGRADVTALMAESIERARADQRAADAAGAEGAIEAGGDEGATEEQAAEFTLLPQDSGIAVYSAAGELAGASVVTGVEFDERTALFVRALGTARQFRSRGIGTVLLGMTPQVLTQAGLPSRSRIVTQIPQVRATFFHRAGFVVEDPAAEVPPALADIGAELLPDFGVHSCWTHLDAQ